MKTKAILTILFALIFSISHAQFDIPPGGIPGFPADNNGCPPGAWCHPNGEGMSFISNDDIDAVNDALEDPEGCCCGCALGKWFLDLIRPAYPPCYPNCNMQESSSSSEGESDETNINKAKPFASKGKISAKTHGYFKTALPKMLYNKGGKAVAIEGLEGTKFKLTGMWVYNEKKKSEFHVLSLEPVDLKTDASYDRLYMVFNKKNMVILNQSWINKKKKKGK